MTDLPDAPDARILIVDDDKAIRDLVRIGLAGSFLVDEAEDGAQARVAVASSRPGLILLDMVLPDVDGLALLQELRAQLSSTPIVMLTASSDEGSEWAARDHGATAFVAKPVGIDDLERLVRRHIQA